MAGRETAGPWNARGDLFRSRPWPLVTTAATTQALAAAVALAEVCGALPELWTSTDHDAAVAAVSHVPQLVASALAASLADVAAASSSWPALGCATPPAWPGRPRHVGRHLLENAAAVAPRLRQVIAELTAVEQALHASETELAAGRRSASAGRSSRLISEGNQVHRRLPQKRWSRLATGVSYGYVSVFVLTSRAGSRTSSVRSPTRRSTSRTSGSTTCPSGRSGLVELTVVAAEVDQATAVLREQGFSATGTLDDEGRR